MDKKDIKIIGSGWGCAAFLKYIDNSKYNVTVISDNSFLYTPLLPSINNNFNLEEDILKINNKITKIDDKVLNVNLTEKKISTKNKVNIDYDYLILCHGAEVNTFNIEGVNKYTKFLKNKNDAETIRKEISLLPKDSNIAVIGCGPTGTEIIGNLIDLNKFNIFAIDGLKQPLSMFSEEISNYTTDLWKEKNVNLYFDRFVQKIDNKNIYFKDNQINYNMAIWCGGIKPNQLTININNQLNSNCRFGIPVSPDLNVIFNKQSPSYFQYLYILIFGKSKSPDTKNVYAFGDCAYSKNPPTAQVAYQQGKYLADNFNKDFKDVIPFKLENKGQICYIGDKKSVYQYNKFTSSGTITYYLNKLIHVYNSVTVDQSKLIFKNMFKNNNN